MRLKTSSQEIGSSCTTSREPTTAWQRNLHPSLLQQFVRQLFLPCSRFLPHFRLSTSLDISPIHHSRHRRLPSFLLPLPSFLLPLPSFFFSLPSFLLLLPSFFFSLPSFLLLLPLYCHFPYCPSLIKKTIQIHLNLCNVLQIFEYEESFFISIAPPFFLLRPL